MAEEAEIWKPKFNPWLIAVVVSLAAFMEILDTSIANVALPHLAGDLRESRDDGRMHLGSDFLPRVQRHYPSHQRMACKPLRPKTLFPGVHLHVHSEFAS